MTQSTKRLDGDDALRLCASNLMEPSKACIKHIHNWRKTYFDSRGIPFE